MPNSAKRDINGLTISKRCGRCAEELGPEHFNPPARCWDCEAEHKAEQERAKALLTPAERLQQALDKYHKEYSHLATSQIELALLMSDNLAKADPAWAEVIAETGLQLSRGPEAIVENDGLIRRMETRLKEAV